MRVLNGIQFIASSRQAAPDRVRRRLQRPAGDDRGGDRQIGASSGVLRRSDRRMPRVAGRGGGTAPAPAGVLGGRVRSDARADADAGIQRRRGVRLLGAGDHGDGVVRARGDRPRAGGGHGRAGGLLRAADGPGRGARVPAQLGSRGAADAGWHQVPAGARAARRARLRHRHRRLCGFRSSWRSPRPASSRPCAAQGSRPRHPGGWPIPQPLRSRSCRSWRVASCWSPRDRLRSGLRWQCWASSTRCSCACWGTSSGDRA